MISPRALLPLAFLGLPWLLAGCGGTTPEVDTAETIKNEPAKSAPTPTPPKEAPKG